ncbi:MAG: hypothetical protein WAL63_09175 [Solirubrobacteraceae bacterium]
MRSAQRCLITASEDSRNAIVPVRLHGDPLGVPNVENLGLVVDLDGLSAIAATLQAAGLGTRGGVLLQCRRPCLPWGGAATGR